MVLRIGHFLQRRGEGFRFRARPPRPLAKRLRLGDLTLGLATRDSRVAIRRARYLRAAADRLFAALERVMTESEAQVLVQRWIEAHKGALTASLDEGRNLFIPTLPAEDPQASAMSEFDCLLRMVETEDVLPDVKHTVSRRLAGLTTPRDERVDGALEDAFQSLASDLDPQSADGRAFRRTFLAGFAHFLDESRKLILGEIPDWSPQSGKPPSAPETEKTSSPDIPFFTHWEEYTQFKVSEKKWKPSALAASHAARRLTDFIFPDISLSAFTKRKVADLRRKMMLLPALRDKAARFRTLSCADLLVEMKKQANQDERRLKLKTVNKHTTYLHNYFSYMVEFQLLPADTKNPFSGFIKHKERGKAAREMRKAWPHKLEEALWNTAIWRGCWSIHRRGRAGSQIFRDARFWVPLFGRLIGARENEICDRLVGDFRADDYCGTWFMTITNSKTYASTRIIPIPQLLLDFGFLEYRILGRDPREPVFPELIPQGVDNTRGAAFTGLFAYYLEITKLKREHIDFHSFRGNVETDLARKGLTGVQIDEIVGHENKERSEEAHRYMKGLELPRVKVWLDQISLAADLSPLRYRGPAMVPAEGAKEEIAEYVRLAELEMRKKTDRRKVSTSPADPTSNDDRSS